MTRQAVLVIGMHRSGTSALAGLLARLGAAVPNTVIAADEHNALGYWESVEFNRFHDRLLSSAGTSWDAWTPLSPDFLEPAAADAFAKEFARLLHDEFGTAPLFVAKDPRICRFVPFWLQSLAASGVDPVPILTIRAPLDVASSLAERNHFGREHSLLIWLRHVLDAESETRAIRRSVVRYRDLLDDWKSVVDRITADTGVEWPRRWEAADAEIAGFLRPELCHHATAADDIGIGPPLSEWVTRTCEAFERLLEPHGTRTREAFEALDDVRRELDRAASQFGQEIEAERHDLRGRVASLQAERRELCDRTDSLRGELKQVREQVTGLESERDKIRGWAAELEKRERSLRADLRTLQSERDELQDRAAGFEHRCQDLERELASARHHVDALLGSMSWRLMAPFRLTMRLLFRLVGRKA
jgi:hypothetical protein